MTIRDFEETMNTWGQQNVPFLFMVDFEMQKPKIWKLDELNSDEVLFSINEKSNSNTSVSQSNNINIIKHPMSLLDYKERFDKVFQHLSFGNSYLTNLTIKTEIELQHSLRDLFYISKAKYKLWYRNEFLVFSPEIFVQIIDDCIYSYPMKGTINAAIPQALEIILNDKKELAEHTTIVDLIRNDLSQIANEVKVEKFRYIDEIKTNTHHLLQVSSKIAGRLQPVTALGTLLIKMLPAGSISGAPKRKTVEIIQEAEKEERGYYTGVMGMFDGKNLDSGVMIRFIEKKNGKYFYRSGGGITVQSNCESEYQEALEKIYVPVN
ncbi:aminodeoxychorismate synthase component I [Chryseosolibacter indicus]|uniref:Aminodeoxychorismate synthase component I n=1 Tax=Chryseosolibacter indicus TaxID=2782351 RepID=A0ABS5VNW0_9BACT|nr:aminodeoxychorismate synthase component I [Chryseosolibacter indicus]MBT1703134.1 aminodeoxychorismate synthase component I [Chryseosolibacter indicus]